MRHRPKLIAMLAALALSAPSFAQDRPPSQQSLRNDPACNQATKAEAATPPARNSGDGTAPGNAGSTGWSGGTGGSFIGTNTSGATRNSPTWQPPTARGLDPIAAPARPASAC
ncbi:hypothetical protein [Roseicella aquatilis]|uniref:Uncharacterized protein n=1 Tax=Roseicella aquatilis TaxID=2527868 RepID=A0A4V2WJR6_9PROT|nr:hypothetical protein [Roseicella aquatilis]TCZ55566.1 hypothetical protein EXY23_21170 [Roseicella aquatilis]